VEAGATLDARDKGRLGHSTITTSLVTNSHVAPGLQQAAANKFDYLLLPKTIAQEEMPMAK